MKDSLELNIQPQTSTEIKTLKQNLQATKKTNNNNSLTTEDIVNFKNFNGTGSSFHKMKKFRSSTPDTKKKFNFLSSFSKSTKNFFTSNYAHGIQNTEDTSDDNLSPIALRNKFQINLGKLNSNSTKEVAFSQLKNIISNNATQDALRVYIGALSSYDQNSSLTAKEILALLYGYIANVYKENLMDPLDKPPNIIKTINRLLTHIRNFYLKENSFVVHKASSHSILDIYDFCMPKDNIKSINILFIEPLVSLISSGKSKFSQDGAAICLADFIYHLGKDSNIEINKKILSTLDTKILSLVTKNSLDVPYIFEALFNLMQFLPFETFTNNLKEIYERVLGILCKANAGKYNSQSKINCLNILGLIAQKCKTIADISIGFYQNDIIKVIEYNTKDKVYKVQVAANDALKNWKELSVIHQDLEKKKTQLVDEVDLAKTKEDYLNKGENSKEEGNYVKKMDKFNFLRNLAKMAKIENKKVDYDTELPEKMREEVYKKGIGNILKLSNFLKYKNNNKNNPLKNGEVNALRRSGSSKKRSKDNRIKMEINDYLKYSEQVKKYDRGNNNINTISNKDKLTQVNEVNELKEVSNRNPSHISNENQNKLNFVEEEVGPGIQAVMQDFENNNNNNNNYENEEINQINEPPIESFVAIKNSTNNNDNLNTITNSSNQRRNKLPKINNNSNISSKPKKLYVNSDEPVLRKPREKQPIDLTGIKKTLSSLITNTLGQTYDNFEKQINSRLYDMENRINDIYLRLSEYQGHPNLNNNKRSMDTVDSKEYHINNEKFKTTNQSQLQNTVVEHTDRSALNRDMIYQEVLNDVKKELNKKQKLNPIDDPSTDSQITKTWKSALYQIEHNNPNEGYQTILNSGDDIYLLRLVCVTGPIFNQLSPDIGRRVLLRINMISRSHQIQSLLINLIRSALDNNVFTQLSQNEQNDLLDSLFEFSGLNTKIGAEAAELYTLITK